MKRTLTASFKEFVAKKTINHSRLISLKYDKNLTLTLDVDADAGEWVIALGEYISSEEYTHEMELDFSDQCNINIKFV